MKYPLWIKIFVAILGGYRAVRQLEVIPTDDTQKKLKRLENLYRNLPIVQGRFWTWIVKQVITWIDLQRLNLVVLAQVGVERVDIVKNDL